jgi:hypothetical protein
MLLNCHSVVQGSTNVSNILRTYGPKKLRLSGLKGKATLRTFCTIKKFADNEFEGARKFLRDEAKNETPNASPVQAAPGADTKAQKVRSSRYEWEGRNNESEKPAVVSRMSLVMTIKALLKKLFSGNRGPGRRGFFDNDDDASPSAA